MNLVNFMWLSDVSVNGIVNIGINVVGKIGRYICEIIQEVCRK